jgi:hypothetical protein
MAPAEHHFQRRLHTQQATAHVHAECVDRGMVTSSKLPRRVVVTTEVAALVFMRFSPVSLDRKLFNALLLRKTILTIT